MSYTLCLSPLLAPLVGDDATAAGFSAEIDFAAMKTFEAELAQAQEKAKQLEMGTAGRIAVAALDLKFDPAKFSAAMARDGVAVPELVKQIRTKLKAKDHLFVHKDATSQDVVDSSFMMRARVANKDILHTLSLVRQTLKSLQIKHGKQKLMGRTRMQAAMPISVEDRLLVWQSHVAAAQEQLLALKFPVQFSGPVGTLKHTKVKKALAKALNLDALEHAWHAERSPILAIANACASVTGALGKIGADVALMAQNEIAEIKLKGGGGSSAMPHKENPVSAEVLVTLARFNAALLGGLHQAAVHEQERSGAAWTLEWMIMPQMIVAAAASAGLANRLLENVESIGK